MAYARAPTPAKVNCASETWPPYPVSSTSESITIAYVAAVPTSSRSASDMVMPSSATRDDQGQAPADRLAGRDGSGADTMPFDLPDPQLGLGHRDDHDEEEERGDDRAQAARLPSLGR